MKEFLKLYESKNEKVWVYDIEIYPNFFCVDFFNGSKHIQFEISNRKNQIDEINKFIKGKIVAGYNNQKFDDLVMVYLNDNSDMLKKYSTESICSNIFELGGKIIDYFQHGTKEESIKKLNSSFKQFQSVDFMKTTGLQKGLKLVGVNLKWKNIQDLPYPWNKPLELDEQIDFVMKYNQNDTEMTYALGKKIQPLLELRISLSEKYNENLMNSSDSQIGNILFEKRYDEKIRQKINSIDGIPEELKNSLLDFRNQRTSRKSIALSEVISPKIKFETRSLNRLLQNLKYQTLYKEEDKSFRLDIPVFEFRGKEYQMGIGGLHSNDKAKIYTSNNNEDLIDSDVTSFYPSMIIQDKIKPLHLDDVYIDCMEEFTKERIEAKKSGDKVKADSGKIVVNSAFGKLGFAGSWSYDEQAMIQVTLNGQLYLLMLIEKLATKDFEVISANTDGIITIVPKTRLEEYNQICNEWMNQTNFVLEFTNYSLYARTNVNNYIAVDSKGKVKTKGVFQYDVTLHQGFSFPVVAEVLKEHLVNKVSVDEALRKHKDIYDFCMAQKMGSQFQAEWGNEPIQKTCRFYVCKSGKRLQKYKVENGIRQYTQLCSGFNVMIFNQYVEKDMKDYNIDYDFYKKEVMKILKELNNSEEGLWSSENSSSKESNITNSLFENRINKIHQPKKKTETESLW